MLKMDHIRIDTGMTISGVDVSSYQPVENWSTVAASGHSFAMVKASESTTYVNPYHAAQWAGAKAAGLAVGAYHYAQPDLNAPEAEAAYFLLAVGDLQEGDVLALDLEEGHGDLSAWALTFLQTVEQRCGFKPLLYTNPAFIAEHNLATPDLAQYGLWLASWQATEPAPPLPWPFIAIWQNSAKGSVPGIPVPVDTDIFNGSIEQFRLYGKPASVVPPFDDAARWQLTKYLAGGSSAADCVAWLNQYIGG